MKTLDSVDKLPYDQVLPSHGPVMLRGLYFTSGTQEGTPIDRMMDSLTRAYGMSVSGASPVEAAPGGQGRSYFIHRLLKAVIFPESGLAGVNWRLEVGRALAQNVAYLVLLGVLGVVVAAWVTSYQYNRGYLADVEAALEAKDNEIALSFGDRRYRVRGPQRTAVGSRDGRGRADPAGADFGLRPAAVEPQWTVGTADRAERPCVPFVQRQLS